MIHDQEQDLPVLIPITQKKQNTSLLQGQPQAQQQAQNSLNDAFNVFSKDHNKSITTPAQKDNANQSKNKKQKEELSTVKIDEFEKNFRQKTSVPKKDDKPIGNNKKNEDNEKSKFLIHQMLNKISAKNITEQLYPVSNQVIDNLLAQIENEIKQLQSQAEKKQNSLLTNPNGQHLKKQLTNIKKSIDRCVTIKQLYHQKVNFRNKIKILEQKIMELRTQNRDLKIKITRGIQTIQNHMHNLPCQRQKQLKQKLNKSTSELLQQKQMRQNLQKNISEIIMNFKRLYQQADTARMIVVSKLKDIQSRQRRISGSQEDQENSAEEIKDLKNTQKILRDSKKEAKDQMLRRSGFQSSQNYNDDQFKNKKIYDQYPKTYQKQKSNRQEIKPQKDQKKMSLEQQIRKMRNNQNMLNRNTNNK